MKKVKEITLVFENCESVDLKSDMFTALTIEGVTTGFCVNCFQYSKGEVCEFLRCNSFGITLKENSNLKTNTGSELWPRVKRFMDITHISLKFSDGTEEYISVPWEGDNESNKLQKVKTTGKYLQIDIRSDHLGR